MLEGYRSQRFPNLRTELLINCSPQASNLWHQGFCWPLKRSLCYIKKLYMVSIYVHICSSMFIYNIVWYSIPTFNYSTTFLQFIPWYLSSKTPPKVEISSNVLHFTAICKKNISHENVSYVSPAFVEGSLFQKCCRSSIQAISATFPDFLELKNVGLGEVF